MTIEDQNRKFPKSNNKDAWARYTRLNLFFGMLKKDADHEKKVEHGV